VTDAALLLTKLLGLGVELTAEGKDLCYDAPAGVLTPDLRSAMAALKADLLALMSAPPPPFELSWDWPDPEMRLIDPAVLGSGIAPAGGAIPWRCNRPLCIPTGRWWMSRWGIVNCLDCTPPGPATEVIATGDATAAPLVDPACSRQAISPESGRAYLPTR
jgi:hypothetical protein